MGKAYPAIPPGDARSANGQRQVVLRARVHRKAGVTGKGYAPGVATDTVPEPQDNAVFQPSPVHLHAPPIHHLQRSQLAYTPEASTETTRNNFASTRR